MEDQSLGSVEAAVYGVLQIELALRKLKPLPPLALLHLIFCWESCATTSLSGPLGLTLGRLQPRTYILSLLMSKLLGKTAGHCR